MKQFTQKLKELIKNTDQKQAKKSARNDESKISCLIPKLLLPLLLVGLCNCSDPSRVFEKNIDLPENIWLADSVATFEFEIKVGENIITVISRTFGPIHIAF